MPTRTLIPLLALLSLASSQQVGTYIRETHPEFGWTQCTADNSCQTVDGALTIDAKWRWLHRSNDYFDCYWYGSNQWDTQVCDSEANCTATCAIEGADYRPKNSYGASFGNDSVTLAVRTWKDFETNIGLRFFLLGPSSESPTRYQTFALLNNEFAFDVDLSTVGCGINSALTFVEMDADGGMARFPSNKAGAAYGTGYCDSKCFRDQRFVGGKANMEGWVRSEEDPYGGVGQYGACCPEFALWNSNSHSYSMSSNLCRSKGYTVCKGASGCDVFNNSDNLKAECDPYGCSYNPYQIGDKTFYGKGKMVDTSRPFTVVTRFKPDRVYQIFVQDGKRIDTPPTAWDGLPKQSGISSEICAKNAGVVGDPYRFGQMNGWGAHIEMLNRPMVLAMSISPDYHTDNLWLDSVYPKNSNENSPGAARGDCPGIGAWDAVAENYDAKVTWSNIRFGPIGTTIRL